MVDRGWGQSGVPIFWSRWAAGAQPCPRSTDVSRGFLSLKDVKALCRIGRARTRQRSGVLRFDFTGIGESGWDFANTSLDTNVQDLVAAAESLAARFETPKLLMGNSLALRKRFLDDR